MRFKSNGDGTVTDTKTGLMWQADPFVPLQETDKLRFLLMTGNPKALKKRLFTWQEAQDYASCLSLAGYNDWRVPTKNKLIGLWKYFNRSAKTKGLFPNTRAHYYWSSTTLAGSTSNAWSAGFHDGKVYYGSKSGNDYVRCVRVGSKKY